jgi:hypothetical protein
LKRRALSALIRVGARFDDSLAPPLWQQGVNAPQGEGQRRFDLVAGVGAAEAEAIRAWLADHNGRTAILVLQHEGLKGVDFGCEVFTQYDVLNACAPAGIVAECDSAFRALSDRLQDVRLHGVEMAPDVLREALLASPRVVEVARAAKVLFERGYRHVAVVIAAHSYLDGALLKEAKSCGVAAPDATAWTPRNGRLVPMPIMTLSTMASDPAQWATHLLRKADPGAAEPAHYVALGFASGSRRALINAVFKEITRCSGDCATLHARAGATGTDEAAQVTPQRFAAISELTVGNPKSVAEALGRLLEAWRADVASRTASEPSNWEAMGRLTIETIEARVLELEESIAPMLRRLARLERLMSIAAWRQPVVVIDDPLACALPPQEPRKIFNATNNIRYVRMPTDIDADDGEVVANLARDLAAALAEERSAAPVAGPQLHVVLGMRPEGVPAVASWLAALEGRRAVLAMHYDSIAASDFGCEVYRELDLVPTNSAAEENIYKSAYEHRTRRQSELNHLRYLGLPLTLDFYGAVAPPAERMMQLMLAARLLFQRGYDHVAIVLGTENDFYGALVLEARACGVMPTNGAVKRVVYGELRPDHGWSMPSFPVSAGQWREKVRERAAAACEATSVAVVALSSEPNYLRNARVVIAALAAREAQLLLIVPRREGFSWAFGNGIAVEPLDQGLGLAAREPERLNRAASAFLRALHNLARRDVGASAQGVCRRLGEATLSFHDLHSATREVVGYALRRHLALLDRLDEVFDSAKPDVVYKFPHCATTMDESLLKLVEAKGIRQVASIFMSIDAQYRNMPRTRQDVITVLGEEQSVLVSANISAAEVICAGQPEMDIMMRDWSPKSAMSHARAAMPAWDGNKKVVLVATSNFDAAGERVWVRELCRRASERGDAHVLVKLHPATPVERYRQELSVGGPIDVSLVADPDITPYMQIASAVVTDVSHAGKIAVYFGRPLMVVNISGTQYPYHRFDESGVALGAYSIEEVAPTLDQVLEGRYQTVHRSRFVQREFTSDDNRASDRIADLVLSLRKS